MLCEYQIQNKDFSTKDIDLAVKLVENGTIDNIVIQPYLLSEKEKYAEILAETSVLIDYPFGLQLNKSREFEVITAAKHGISSIDIVLNQHLLNSGHYGLILKELTTLSKIKKDYNLVIRVLLDYTASTEDDILTLAYELPEVDIETVVSSTMMYSDTPVDNIIFSQNISSKTNISVIAASNMWLPKHHKLCKNAGVSGFRSNSIHFLSNLQKMVYNN